MEQKKYVFPSNLTMPGSGKNFKNFCVDKKNARAVHDKFVRFNAKQDLKNGVITEYQYNEILKQIFQNK